MRRAVLVAVLAAAVWSPFMPAHADDTVVVPGLAFPSSDTYLTYFGCTDLFQGDNQAPQVRIGKDGVPPAGRRSFGLLVPGSGTASGPVHRVDSVADTTVSGFSARADDSSTGVAYVWYVSRGIDSGQVWAGRAALSVGSSWQYVDTTAATYEWKLVEASTGEVVEDAGMSTIADFTAANGDGPGYLLAGLGCDGKEFSIDALRVGSAGAVTTFDLEGIKVSTTMQPDAPKVRYRGDPIALTGLAVDATGAPVGAPMALEARPAGATKFRPIGDPITADTDGHVRTTVEPERTTTYRWYLPGIGYADASRSASITVVVVPDGSKRPTGPPSGTPGPSGNQSDAGSGDQSDEGSGDQEAEVPPLPSQSPTPTPTDPPTDEPTDPPTSEPTDPPTSEPTDPPTSEPTDPLSDSSDPTP